MSLSVNLLICGGDLLYHTIVTENVHVRIVSSLGGGTHQRGCVDLQSDRQRDRDGIHLPLCLHERPTEYVKHQQKKTKHKSDTTRWVGAGVGGYVF